MSQDPVLQTMVSRLVDTFHPLQIYLFGSHARQDTTADSDYDLLVVVGESNLPVYKRAQLAFRVLCGLGAAKDVIVYTQDEFTRKRSVPASLPATVIREGKLLYGA
ncbi:MAG: nucleotidyltransferase domain-containing protein [Candidatus Hydrogenedentes bacterium]|nr:nucleotidyltransferase domain-containing protein [Candidatus Hydrogenedentota bacterium]